MRTAALSLLMALAFCPQASAAVRCELTRVTTLGGWADADAIYWRKAISREVTERVQVFIERGRFEPKTWTLHGNTATIPSARIVHNVFVEKERTSAKIPDGIEPGTVGIPKYRIETSAEQGIERETYTVTNLVFRLPVADEHLQRIGAHSPVHIDAVCERSRIPAVAGFIARAKPKRKEPTE
jgi:hypothetical protein